MGRDTGIADRLRKAGLRVVETSGWTTRGSTDFNPRGSVNHHTAGPATGATPSLNTCINGRPGLSGPLCNVFQSREPNPADDVAYIVAAGRANHAGEGGWRGLSGNSSVYGLEIEHTGTSLLSTTRQEVAAAIHAAMFSGDVSMVCQHFEWAPTRKIDAATGVTGDGFRNLVSQARQGGFPEDDLTPDQAQSLDRVEVMLEELLFGWRENGTKIPAGQPAGRLKEMLVGLRDEAGVPIPDHRVGGRIKRIDENSTDLATLAQAVVDALLPHLPPPDGGSGGATAAEVKKALQEVFAEVRYTVAPADVTP